jgi:1-acyl-sn-glycerol-3-phosphate acyltransferase
LTIGPDTIRGKRRVGGQSRTTKVKVESNIARFTVHDTPIVEPFLRATAHLFLKATGWRRVGRLPDRAQYLMIGAPHTSYWDAVYAMAIALAFRLRVFWMAKHTVFRWPFRSLLRWLGGVPIDRCSRHDVVSQCVEHFRANQRFILAVLPEGTRRKVDSWKSGFYHIAKGAGVPVLLAFLDYPSRTGGLGPLIWLTDKVETDLAVIAGFYSTKTGKNPECTGPVRLSLSAEWAE